MAGSAEDSLEVSVVSKPSLAKLKKALTCCAIVRRRKAIIHPALAPDTAASDLNCHARRPAEGLDRMALLTEVMSLLRRIQSLRFDARSKAATGWDEIGTGVVTVTEPSAGCDL